MILLGGAVKMFLSREGDEDLLREMVDGLDKKKIAWWALRCVRLYLLAESPRLFVMAPHSDKTFINDEIRPYCHTGLRQA